jgi:hypothetical protein
MPIDFKSLKKLESLPASVGAAPLDATRHLLVLVKLTELGQWPDYVTARAKIGPRMFSAEIAGSDLKALESDPNVESVAISRQIPLMKQPSDGPN